MRKKPIPYGHQWISEEDIGQVAESLRGDWITQGPKVEEFEKKVTDFCGAKYGVAVNNGTSALQVAYKAVGIREGDEVITSPLTFAATSNALVHCGAKPVFVDVEEDTLNINPEKIKQKITRKTKGLAVTDFGGHPCDLDEIRKVAEKSSLFIIEDGAHALGSEYKGRKVGSISDITIFSFHPVKLITTGEGGMVVTDNRDFYEKMRVLRHHGIEKKPEKGGWYYEINKPGYNFRLTDFQSALGISQLEKAPDFIKRRREIVARYNQAFSSIKELILPVEKEWAMSAWHIYPVQFRLERLRATRREVFEHLGRKGLKLQVHYMPLHLHPFYSQKFGYEKGDFPVAERYYERAITLPLFPRMSEEEIKYVIKTIKETVLEVNKS